MTRPAVAMASFMSNEGGLRGMMLRDHDRALGLADWRTRDEAPVRAGQLAADQGTDAMHLGRRALDYDHVGVGMVKASRRRVDASGKCVRGSQIDSHTRGQ